MTVTIRDHIITGACVAVIFALMGLVMWVTP